MKSIQLFEFSGCRPDSTDCRPDSTDCRPDSTDFRLDFNYLLAVQRSDLWVNVFHFFMRKQMNGKRKQPDPQIPPGDGATHRS